MRQRKTQKICKIVDYKLIGLVYGSENHKSILSIVKKILYTQYTFCTTSNFNKSYTGYSSETLVYFYNFVPRLHVKFVYRSPCSIYVCRRYLSVILHRTFSDPTVSILFNEEVPHRFPSQYFLLCRLDLKSHSGGLVCRNLPRLEQYQIHLWWEHQHVSG